MLNLPIKILQTIKIETAQATIEFTGIDTLVALWDAVARVTSRHLVLIVNAASDQASGNVTIVTNFNGDGGANYNRQYLGGTDAAVSAGVGTGIMGLRGLGMPGTTMANAFGGGILLVPHAFNTANHKASITLGGAAEAQVRSDAERWASVAAITSLTMIPSAGNFAIGSTIHLGVIDERYLVEEIELLANGYATFDNIPQGEGDLVVIGYSRSLGAWLRTSLYHYFNDDTVAANYSRQYLRGMGGVPSATQANNEECGAIPANTSLANVFGGFAAIYSQYTKGNQPHFLVLSGFHESSAPDSDLKVFSGRRANIEPINKIEYQSGGGMALMLGSLFSLYRVPKRIIERFELTAPQATITFDNIPQNFEALLLNVYARSSEAAVADEIAITINADGDPDHYDWQEVEGTGAGPPTATRNLSSQQLMYIPADNEGAGEFGGGSAMFLGYAETDRHKHIICLHGRQENQVILSSHRWESLNAITTIALSPVGGPNFMTGTVVELEGILRKEGLPPSEGHRIG